MATMNTESKHFKAMKEAYWNNISINDDGSINDKDVELSSDFTNAVWNLVCDSCKDETDKNFLISITQSIRARMFEGVRDSMVENGNLVTEEVTHLATNYMDGRTAEEQLKTNPEWLGIVVWEYTETKYYPVEQ